MLSVQPNFSSNVKPVNFRGQDDDNFYQSKTRFYEEQRDDFAKLANDTDTPKSVKKVMNVFKIVSEALLEGWAVAWGASKGAKFLKSTAVSGANSKFAGKLKDIMNPIKKGFGEAGKKIGETFSNTFKKIGETPAFTKLKKHFNSLIDKMEKTKVGKTILKGFRVIGKGFKAITNKISKIFTKISNKIKAANGEEVYDKTTKVAATTLGVGAGTAEAYNKAFHPENKEGQDTKNIDLDLEEDYE